MRAHKKSVRESAVRTRKNRSVRQLSQKKGGCSCPSYLRTEKPGFGRLWRQFGQVPARVPRGSKKGVPRQDFLKKTGKIRVQKTPFFTIFWPVGHFLGQKSGHSTSCFAEIGGRSDRVPGRNAKKANRTRGTDFSLFFCFFGVRMTPE